MSTINRLPSNTAVGVVVTRLRVRANLSQGQVAERVFGSAKFQGNISKIEMGEKRAGRKVLEKYARAFNVSVADIVDNAYTMTPTLESTTPIGEPA